MTRIISGRAKGRRLRVPSAGVRPTSSRVREALFSSISGLIERWEDERILDVFAGSGALGLEALSRGAEDSLFVENNRQTVVDLRSNIATVGVGGEVLVADALSLPPTRRGHEATIVFADPPYDIDPLQLSEAMSGWLEGGWIAQHAIIALEGPARWSEWVWPAGVDEIQSRRYGDTSIWYGSAEMID